MPVPFHIAILLLAAVFLLLLLTFRISFRPAVSIPLLISSGPEQKTTSPGQTTQWLPSGRWDLREARRGSPVHRRFRWVLLFTGG